MNKNTNNRRHDSNVVTNQHRHESSSISGEILYLHRQMRFLLEALRDIESRLLLFLRACWTRPDLLGEVGDMVYRCAHTDLLNVDINSNMGIFAGQYNLSDWLS